MKITLSAARRLLASGMVGVVAAGVSATLAGVPSYWGDEVATVRASGVSLDQLAQFLRFKDAVHGAYYLVMHLWSAVFGTSELWMRLPSALAVGAAATGIAWIAGRFGRPRLGLAAALLFAVLPRTTSMGSEARGYAFAAAAAVLMTAMLLVALDRGRLWWAVYAVVGVLGTVLFLYDILVVAAHLVFVLSSASWRKRLPPFLGAAAVVGVLVAPFGVAVSRQRDQVAWLGDPGVLTVWTVVVEPWFESSWAVAVACLVLLGVGVVRAWTRAGGQASSDPITRLAAAWVVAPTVLLLVANAAVGPLYTARYLSFAEPGLALLVAIAVREGFSARRRWIPIVLIMLLAAPTWWAQRGEFARNGGSDLRQVADVVAADARPGDALLFVPARHASQSPRLALGGYPDRFAGLDDIALVERFPATTRFADRTAPLAGLHPELLRVQRLWLVTPGSCRSTPTLADLRDSGLRLGSDRPVGRDSVCLFERARA